MTLTEAMAAYQSAVDGLRAKAKVLNSAQSLYDEAVSKARAALDSAKNDYNSALKNVSATKAEFEVAISNESADVVTGEDKPVVVIR